MLISQNYLMHHGVKGMKWGVRHDPERAAQRAKAKAVYKETKKDLKEQSRKNYKDFKETYKFSKNLYKKGLKVNKQAYKSGKIDKENYKDYKRKNRELRNEAYDKLSYNMAVNQYKLTKAQQANKAIYYKDIYGAKSRQYKRGMRAVKSSYASFGDYVVRQNSDGTYHVTRYTYG